MIVITTAYDQQRIMFKSETHNISQRIVSLVNCYARNERLDFDSLNEAEGLERAVGRYRDRNVFCFPPAAKWGPNKVFH